MILILKFQRNEIVFICVKSDQEAYFQKEMVFRMCQQTGSYINNNDNMSQHSTRCYRDFKGLLKKFIKISLSLFHKQTNKNIWIVSVVILLAQDRFAPKQQRQYLNPFLPDLCPGILRAKRNTQKYKFDRKKELCFYGQKKTG